MSSNNTQGGPPERGEAAAALMTALRGSLENLDKALNRGGLKRIKELVAECRHDAASVQEVRADLDPEVVATCMTELQNYESKAIAVARKYYDDGIDSVEALLGMEGSSPGMGPRAIPNDSPAAADTARSVDSLPEQGPPSTGERRTGPSFPDPNSQKLPEPSGSAPQTRGQSTGGSTQPPSPQNPNTTEHTTEGEVSTAERPEGVVPTERGRGRGRVTRTQRRRG